MARLLANGDIRHPKVQVIRDGEKTFRASEDVDIAPKDPEYADYIVWLPPADQETAWARFREAQSEAAADSPKKEKREKPRPRIPAIAHQP